MTSVVTKRSPGTLNIGGVILNHGPNIVVTALWMKMVSHGPHSAKLKKLIDGNELSVRHRQLPQNQNWFKPNVQTAPDAIVLPEVVEVEPANLPITGFESAIVEEVMPMTDQEIQHVFDTIKNEETTAEETPQDALQAPVVEDALTPVDDVESAASAILLSDNGETEEKPLAEVKIKSGQDFGKRKYNRRNRG